MTHPYQNSDFARSLAHWGAALHVPAWHTSVIVRNGQDAAGVYPFAVLPPDADITAGLDFLKHQGLASVVLVLDEFHHPSLDALKPHFTLLRPFKEHYIYRPARGPIAYDSHHKRALKKANAQVTCSVVDMHKHWRDWAKLYEHLIRDMRLSGLHAFPDLHHEALSKIEGFTTIGAWIDGELVSAHVWAHSDTHAHSHLVASNEKGYEARASFATNDFSMQHFANHEVINFGGGAGVATSEGDGLARFKRGFSNDVAHSYIAGAILDEARYAALCEANPKAKDTAFFPAYRA